MAKLRRPYNKPLKKLIITDIVMVMVMVMATVTIIIMSTDMSTNMSILLLTKKTQTMKRISANFPQTKLKPIR